MCASLRFVAADVGLEDKARLAGEVGRVLHPVKAESLVDGGRHGGKAEVSGRCVLEDVRRGGLEAVGIDEDAVAQATVEAGRHTAKDGEGVAVPGFVRGDKAVRDGGVFGVHARLLGGVVVRNGAVLQRPARQIGGVEDFGVPTCRRRPVMGEEAVAGRSGLKVDGCCAAKRITPLASATIIAVF